MSRKLVKSISLLLALLLLGASFAGCAKSGNQTDGKSATAAGSSGAQTNENVYPLKGEPKLTYWMPMHANWIGFAKNFSELPFAQELSKRTGVKIEYIHPAVGQEQESFNILVASGDYPDIIEYKWTDFPGGPSAAINNGVITKLNDTIKKFAPNLQKFYTTRPDIEKQAKTDDGTYYFFPFIRDGKELQNTSGPIVRKDWLDDVGLGIPETVDDWYNMLKAFKEKKNATAPLTAVGDKNGAQALYLYDGAFGLRADFYVDNGKIKYGPAEPQYKDLLVHLNKLYQEGLLDKNFAMTDRKAQDSNMLNGKSGVTYAAGGGSLGVWLTTMKDKDPKYNASGVKYPVQKKGDRSKFGQGTNELDRNTQVAITTKCKNVEAAARLLDYGYSPEGHLLYNYGIEGTSYKMVNGVPTYSDTVMKNPDKLTVAQAMTKYARGNTSGPFLQDKGYIQQYYELQQQKDALKAWADHDKVNNLIPLITPTDAESSDFAKIMNDIMTYVQEMQYKMIMGTEPISNFDKFQDQLKKMNIDKAIQIRQAELDRLNKR